MKLPKIHLAVSHHELRPVMNHVYVNKDHIVATDSHMLVRYDRSIINFIEGLPEDFLVRGDEWSELTKEFITARYSKSENMIFLKDKKGKTRVVTLVDHASIGKYPNYNAVIPSESKMSAFEAINFNSSLMKSLTDSVAHGNVSTMIRSTGIPGSALYFTFRQNGEDLPVVALLMPERI